MCDFPRLDLYLSRTADHLFATVVADTPGWVAVGLGSYLMDSSRIMFGFVHGGRPVFIERIVTDHQHIDTEQPLQAEAVLADLGRQTTMELRVPWPAPLITAYSTQESLTQIHRFNRAVVAQLLPVD